MKKPCAGKISSNCENVEVAFLGAQTESREKWEKYEKKRNYPGDFKWQRF